eukprot:gene604-752_t
MQNLNSLNISNVNLKGIPNDLCKFRGSSLDATNNFIQSIPNCMKCEPFKFTSSMFAGNSPTITVPTTPDPLTCNRIIYDARVDIRAFGTNGGYMDIRGSMLGWGDYISSPFPFNVIIPNQRIRLTMPEGTGYNHVLTMTMTPLNIQVSFDYTYPSPTVSEYFYVPSNSSLIFIGENFGKWPERVKYKFLQDPQFSATVQSVNHTKLSLNVLGGKLVPAYAYLSYLEVDGQDIQGHIFYLEGDVELHNATLAPPQGGIVTIFGKNFGMNTKDIAKLYVDGVDISPDIINVDNQKIVCTVPSGNGSVSVEVSIIGYWAYKADLLTYKEAVEPIKCPGNPECSEKGTCVNGKCFCNDGWSGEICDYAQTESNVTIGENPNPVITSKNLTAENITFGFFVRSILEINGTNSVVKEHFFSSWNLTESSDSRWVFLNNETTAQINCTLEYFKEPKTRRFANMDLNIAANSLKLSVNISGWQYLQTTNHLSLTIESYVKYTTSQCIDDETNVTTDGDINSLNYIQIQRNNQVFYGRFLDRVECGGRASISKSSIYQKTNDSIIIKISMPSNCPQAYVDPDFSLLINPKKDPTSDNCGKTEKDDNKIMIIAVSVVAGVIGAAIIVGSVLFIRMRIQKRKDSIDLDRKLKKLG